MAKGYHHMTREQRSQIQVLMSIGMSYKQIAQALGFDKASICRELKRNSNNGVYDFEFADKASKNKRSSSPPNPAKIVGETAEIIRKLLQKNWSPEQISGRLKLDGICIGRQTIYNYIWEDKESGGTLYTCLRHRGKKYNKRSSKTSGRGLIPNRVDIKERPKIVESKTRIGDFEGDTIIGANHKGAIVSIVDRASKFTLLKKVPRKQTELVIQAITDKLKNIPHKVLSITFDNGKEFAAHEKLSSEFATSCYFATPYHSWERGLNEHTNGLVRQYLPKKTNFQKVSEEEIQWIEDVLNDRPRKILNYKTPREVFFSSS